MLAASQGIQKIIRRALNLQFVICNNIPLCCQLLTLQVVVQVRVRYWEENSRTGYRKGLPDSQKDPQASTRRDSMGLGSGELKRLRSSSHCPTKWHRFLWRLNINFMQLCFKSSVNPNVTPWISTFLWTPGPPPIWIMSMFLQSVYAS